MKCSTFNRKSIIILIAIFFFSFCHVHGKTNTSIKKKAKKFTTLLKKNNNYPWCGKDTLVDLNGDHYKDILIEFYATAGTGLKNGVEVYLYDHVKQKFVACEQLNHLGNPTFYFNKKIVVGYYVGGGGGSATKLRWNGLKLDTLQNFDIDVIWAAKSVSFKLVSYNYITRKKSTKVVESMALPKEYNYCDYTPIIKPE